MTRLLRPCPDPDCGELLASGTRHDHRRREPRVTDTGRWQRLRRAAIAEHRRTVGDWCPGWRRDPHPATRLTLDHVVPLAQGGEPFGAVQVLCASCNAAKRDRLP